MNAEVWHRSKDDFLTQIKEMTMKTICSSREGLMQTIKQ
jgi:hypothetical protein